MVLVKQVFVLAAVFGLASAHANGIQHRRSFGRRQGGSGNDTKDATTKDGDSKGDSSLTSSLLPAVSLPSDVLDTKSSTTESSTETNTKESTTSSDETKTTPTSTPTDDPTTTSSPTSSDTDTDSKTTTTTTDGPTKTPDDPLSSILSSILDPITGTPTTTTDDPTTTPTSTPTDPTSTPTDPTSSSDSDSSSSSSSDPTVSLPITISDLPTISLPITITTPTDSPTDSPTGSPTDSPTESPTDPPTISNPVTDPPVTDPPVTDPPVTDPPVTDPPVTDPPITTPPPNGTVIVDPPTITQDPPTITEQPTDPSPSPNTTVISFPQGTDGSTVIDTSTEVATTTVYSVTIASDFDFFSATTLALAPEPTTTTAPTLSDPDAATAAPSAATTLLVAPLPSDVPGRVYPPSDPDPEKVADKTLVSLLLDTGRLPWKYVVDHDNASTQIFALMPGIVDGAVGITDTNDQTQTLYLQAFVPADYTGPSDLEKVGTLTFLYVKTDAVNDLASQIKVKTSPFYTGPSDPMSKALANLVVASYNILSVSDPNSDGSGTTSNASVSGGSSKTREDAIIGVVSALGGVALLVLLFLLYRAYKRRQQLANRRLSDPPNTYIGERTPGRDFDQDSVGGQRRRSFYFAEDSLRGAGQESQSSGGQAGSSGWVSFGQDGQGRVQEDEYWDYSRSQGQQMSQRRPVAGGNISAPILRGSTMNW